MRCFFSLSSFTRQDLARTLPLLPTVLEELEDLIPFQVNPRLLAVIEKGLHLSLLAPPLLEEASWPYQLASSITKMGLNLVLMPASLLSPPLSFLSFFRVSLEAIHLLWEPFDL